MLYSSPIFLTGFKSFAQVYSIQIFIFFSPASLNIVLILCDAQALRGEGGGEGVDNTKQ
jgi:hypothetical protein